MNRGTSQRCADDLDGNVAIRSVSDSNKKLATNVFWAYELGMAASLGKVFKYSILCHVLYIYRCRTTIIYETTLPG